MKKRAECHAVVNFNHIYDATEYFDQETNTIQLDLNKFFDYNKSKAEPEEIDEAEKQFRHYMSNQYHFLFSFIKVHSCIFLYFIILVTNKN